MHAVRGGGAAPAGADDNIEPPLVELCVGDVDGGIESIFGQGRVQNLVADDIRTTGQVLAELYRLDVLGTRAFRTLAYGIGDLLAFMQGLETDALEGRCVEEEVFVAISLDESEVLVREFLDTTFRHLCVSRINGSTPPGLQLPTVQRRLEELYPVRMPFRRGAGHCQERCPSLLGRAEYATVEHTFILCYRPAPGIKP